MNTVDGYAMSSWERGYGDMVMARTSTRCGWSRGYEATAMVLCDVQWLDGSPVVASPRQILRRSWTGWPSGVRSVRRHRAGVHRFDDTFEDAPGTRYRDLAPANQYNVDYSLLGTARIEPLLRDIRNGMAGAGLYVESAKGECNLGQHEIAFRYAERWPPATTTRSTRPAPRRSPPSTARA